MINYSFVALPKIYRHLSGNELKVFVTMFDQWSQMKNEDGWYYRSQKQLCEDTGLTDRTLRDIIKKFVEKGVIFTTTYNDGVKMATYNKANEYKINMEKVVEMSKEKVVKNTIEGGNFYHPSKNKENNNKNNKETSSVVYNVTIDTLQVPGVMSDEHNVSVNTPTDNNNDDFFNFEEKENERSDGRNDCNERQSKGEATLRKAEGKTITSTLGENNITSTEYRNVPIQTPKVKLNPPPPLTTKDIEDKIDTNGDAWDSFFEHLFSETA